MVCVLAMVIDCLKQGYVARPGLGSAHDQAAAFDRINMNAK